MNLIELQRRMSEDVMRPLTPEFADAASRGRRPTDEPRSLPCYVKPNSLLSSFERLEIYNRQYWFRVIGAVSEDYPALNAVLGQKRFDALILAYLRAESFHLIHAARPWRQVANMARDPSRTNRGRAINSRSTWPGWNGPTWKPTTVQACPPLSAAEFASLLPDSVLSLQPHLQLLDLRYPVDEVVLAVRQNTTEYWHRQQCRFRRAQTCNASAATQLAPFPDVSCGSPRRELRLLSPHRARGLPALSAIRRETPSQT